MGGLDSYQNLYSICLLKKYLGGSSGKCLLKHPEILYLNPVDLFDPIRVTFDRDSFGEKTLLSSRPIRYKQVGLEVDVSVSTASVTLDILKLIFNDFVIESGIDFLDFGNSPSYFRSDYFDIVLYPYPVPEAIERDRFDNFFEFKYEQMLTQGYSEKKATQYFNDIISFEDFQLTYTNPVDYSFGLTQQTRLEFKLSGKNITFGGELKGLVYCPMCIEDYYAIDFFIIPEQDNVDYCPLNTTGFYDFDTPPN